MTVAAGRLDEAVILVVAHHSLVAVALAALLYISLDFHAQDALDSASLGQDAVRPVAHGLGIVLIAGAVLGLGEGVDLSVFTVVSLLTLTLERRDHEYTCMCANNPERFVYSHFK